MIYPHYCVKRSTLPCDRDGGRNEYVWNVWKIATPGQMFRCLGGYRTEAIAQDAAAADRQKGPHRY